ncbi:hypothetical protein [Staphylococcus kloosii]|uniref:DUF5082 domain-containing protein n=1 Tax=Staphylococcus kloosii TaxID=29384 RepID=A0ABQ0XM65_9STAP|nr:hypothetical protein [Staphylococcus kloosii]AVQ35762.1 hypothetical protein C7J89_06325 [Staphylococcus kloosii]PNZ01910.1 hypothetical protein CD136_12935 [Staphylococcus kloosii]GEP82517.1 hypothetical protein SKL01_16950 [Staphylococcus kloosii]SUM48820.1 Uncharacterised protein [Staphylococcus kloosii]
MITFKEQTKVSWNEGKYKKTLSDEELKTYKSLTRNEKDYLVLFYLDDTPISLSDRNWFSELSNRINEREKEQSREIVEKNLRKEEKVNKKFDNLNDEQIEFKEAKAALGGYMARRGLTNLTKETQKLLIDGNYKSNLDSFQSGWAKISGNPYQNTIINTNIGQLDTNLAQIKLMDNMLKDNKELCEQNEKLIKQNNEIIELLKTIANK